MHKRGFVEVPANLLDIEVELEAVYGRQVGRDPSHICNATSAESLLYLMPLSCRERQWDSTYLMKRISSVAC